MNNTEISEIAKYVSYLENEGNILVKPTNMGGHIGGFVIPKNQFYYIFINTNLSYEEQLKVLYHEAKHVYDIENGIVTNENECDSFSSSYFEVACESVNERSC